MVFRESVQGCCTKSTVVTCNAPRTYFLAGSLMVEDTLHETYSMLTSLKLVSDWPRPTARHPRTHRRGLAKHSRALQAAYTTTYN